MNYLVAPPGGPHFFLFVDRTARPGEPSRAGRGRGAVSARDWDAVRESLTLLSIPGMRDFVRTRAAKRLRNA